MTTTLDPRRLDPSRTDHTDNELAHVVDIDDHGRPDPIALCGTRIAGIPASWDTPTCIVCFSLAGLSD